MSIVGENIRRRRTVMGLSQAALAKKALVSQSAISDIENPNVTKLPNVDTIGKIAKALECTVNDLIEGNKKEKKQEADIDPLLQQIMMLARQLTPDRRRQLLDFARFQAGQQ